VAELTSSKATYATEAWPNQKANEETKEQAMSKYRFLSNAYVGGLYYQPGDIASTSDAGGTLPTNFKPGPFVDPLDTPAVNALYALGPQFLDWEWGLDGLQTSPPITYWKPTSISGGRTSWSLTGLGIGLQAINN
jgi:hypothetical protein